MNTVSTQKRKYRLQARADSQQETRERIVAATVGLHRKVGPARTTIADIARTAGVQRLTVYNHFPTLSDLLGACQGHFLRDNPPPDLTPGVPRARALARLESALTELYGWYRAERAMERHIHGDRHLVPELDSLLRRTMDPVFARAADGYGRLLGRRARQLVRLALAFDTWDLLATQGLTDPEIARLFREAAACIRRV